MVFRRSGALNDESEMEDQIEESEDSNGENCDEENGNVTSD
jgi:hypothetical protein